MARMQALLNLNFENVSQPGFDINNFINEAISSALQQDNKKDAFHFYSMSDPFRNMLESVLIAFFDGCSVNISKEKVKLIFFMLQIVVAMVKTDSSLELPTLNYLLKYNENTGCRIPNFPTTEHSVVNLKTGKTHKMYMNKPSKYMEFLMADPINNPVLANSLSDFTPDELYCLQQGDKWKITKRCQPLTCSLPWLTIS